MKGNLEPDNPEFRQLEEKEVEGYAQAKSLRHEILQEVINKAAGLMTKIGEKAHDNELMTIPEISSKIPKGVNDGQRALSKLGTFLDVQANQLLEWRESAVRLLTKPLVDGDDEGEEITGDEYEESTKTQDEVMVLVMALRTLISDRRDLLTGQQNLLTKNEVKNALASAKEGKGLFPEKTIDLLNIRQKLKAEPDAKSLRAIVSEARTLVSESRARVRTGSSRHQT